MTKGVGASVKGAVDGESVRAVAGEEVLPRRYEKGLELRERLRQLYHMKLDQLHALLSRIDAVGKTLDYGFYSADMVNPTRAQSVQEPNDYDSTAIPRDEDDLLPSGGEEDDEEGGEEEYYDVSATRFAVLESELVRGKSEVTKRTAQLADTFLQIEWHYAELGIEPGSEEALALGESSSHRDRQRHHNNVNNNHTNTTTTNTTVNAISHANANRRNVHDPEFIEPALSPDFSVQSSVDHHQDESDPFLTSTPTPASRVQLGGGGGGAGGGGDGRRGHGGGGKTPMLFFDDASRVEPHPFSSSSSARPAAESHHRHHQLQQQQQQNQHHHHLLTLFLTSTPPPTPSSAIPLLTNTLRISPTPALLLFAQSHLTALSSLKAQRENQIQALYDQLEPLWLRCGVPPDEIDGFVETHRGSTRDVVQAYEDEVKRMLDVRRDSLSHFVHRARQEISTLWETLMFSASQRTFPGLSEDEVYTEHLLERHEEEIKRLREMVGGRGSLLGSVRRYFEICEEERELEESAKDQTRLLSRGASGGGGGGRVRSDPGRLLREEKMRKRVVREKPKLEQQLLNSLPAWEQLHGMEFLVWGDRLLDLLHQSVASHPAGSSSSAKSVYAVSGTGRTRSGSNSNSTSNSNTGAGGDKGGGGGGGGATTGATGRRGNSVPPPTTTAMGTRDRPASRNSKLGSSTSTNASSTTTTRTGTNPSSSRAPNSGIGLGLPSAPNTVIRKPRSVSSSAATTGSVAGVKRTASQSVGAPGVGVGSGIGGVPGTASKRPRTGDHHPSVRPQSRTGMGTVAKPSTEAAGGSGGGAGYGSGLGLELGLGLGRAPLAASQNKPGGRTRSGSATTTTAGAVASTTATAGPEVKRERFRPRPSYSAPGVPGTGTGAAGKGGERVDEEGDEDY